MPIKIVTVPCRSDNYAFLIHEAETGETALVDAPEVAPIKAALDQRGWNLTHILITHHHDDHIAGVDALRDAYGAQVIGAKADAHRLPALDLAVAEGEALSIAGHDVQIFDVSGHTVGHIAFYIPDAKAVFTADSLMALGCGRLFEGTPRMMWTSLSKLAALPEDTIVCSGHEYTAANAKFALTIEPENEALQNRVTDIATARARGEATVPSRLALELATNPFLRASLSAVKASLNMSGTEDADVFAEIRARKDRF
jgi:hydroxyacylglutathione hydrolase